MRYASVRFFPVTITRENGRDEQFSMVTLDVATLRQIMSNHAIGDDVIRAVLGDLLTAQGVRVDEREDIDDPSSWVTPLPVPVETRF